MMSPIIGLKVKGSGGKIHVQWISNVDGIWTAKADVWVNSQCDLVMGESGL